MKIKLTKRQQTLFYIICLAIWVAMINAGRGSGISGLKPFQVLFMFTCGWLITKNWWIAFWYAFPILALFWIGTGEMMPYFTPYMSWRAAEMYIGAGWTLIIFIPLWLRKKI